MFWKEGGEGRGAGEKAMGCEDPEATSWQGREGRGVRQGKGRQAGRGGGGEGGGKH